MKNQIQDYKTFSVFRLALPIFFQMLFSMILGYTDTVMLSHYSENSVGAVGNASGLLNFIILAFSIISSATGVVVAQYIGAKKHSELDKIYSVSVAFNLVLSVFVCLVVFFGAPLFLKLMKIPSEMLEDSVNYIRITGFFLFAQAITGVFQQIFVCNGKTQLTMFISFGMSVINIIGNYIFLYGFLKDLNFGVKGVAISTSFSNICAMIFSYICFIKIIKGKISIKYLIPYPKELIKDLLKLGIPSAGENISYTFSQMVILSFVNLMGTVSINTRIFCNSLGLISMLYSNSVGGAVSIIAGQAVGANDYDFAYKKVLKSTFLALGISAILAGLNAILSKYTLRLFTNDLQVIQLGSKVMIVAFFLELGRCINIVVIRALRASGDILFPTILGIVFMWGISVVFAFILGLVFKLNLIGVWIAMALDEISRGIIVLIRWKKGTWRNKNIVR